MSPWITSSVRNSLEKVKILNVDLSEQKIQKLQIISLRQGRHLTPEIPLSKACTVFPLWNV